MIETIILMHTNLMEASQKTGMSYEDLEQRYKEALEHNRLVTLTITDGLDVVITDE